MKYSIFISLAILLFSSGCKILHPQGEPPRKAIHFCGEFKHGDQPASDCDCTAEKTQDSTGQIVTIPKYTYFDRFGNNYCNLNIKDPCATSEINQRSIVPGVNFTGSPNRTSSGGLFKLYVSDLQNGLTTGFGNTSNTVFLDVITQVFSDLDAMLVHPPSSCGNPFVPVNIEIQSINSPGSGILGEASPYWENLGETNGILHNEVWKGICSGANDPNLWDGFIRINLGYSNWYTGYDGNVPAGKVDLYTVVLHEVLHAMGFASLIAQDGKSKRWANGTPSNLYNIFDQNLKFENAPAIINNAPLITNSGGYNTLYNINSNPAIDLRSGCQNPTPFGPDIKFSGNYIAGNYAFAPATWSNGSSLSHFQINCDGSSTSQFVMNASISTGASRRITSEEANALCDMGYKLTGNYGTSTLDVSGGPNPNIKIVPACGELLVAVDDDGPCCTTNKFTVQFCPGNTLIISPNDLICNDVYSGTVNVVDFENISTGALMPFSGGNFVFTPTQLGTEVFRYWLGDNLGNRSNYAYVEIEVWHCPSFNCTNTSLCNLICNPSLEDFDNNCTCTMGGMNPTCLEGWSPMFYSPDYPCSYPNNAVFNWAYLPSNPGGMICLAGWDISQPGWTQNEAIMTKTNLSDANSYIFSVFAKDWRADNIYYPNVGLEFGFLFQNDIYWNTNSGPVVSLPINSQIAAQINTGNLTNDWKQFVFCFTPNNDYDILFISAFNTGFSSLFTDNRVFIDQIELIRDEMDEINLSSSTLCNQSIIIGSNLCGITNITYSWWDVTNSGSPVQITNGTTVLAGGVSIPNGNTNGSQIQVSPNTTTVYELRRRMISTNGIPIAMNNCDKDVQVTVNVNTNIQIQKNITSGTTASPGSTVQFQLTVTNSTGSNLTSVAVEDVLHPDLPAGTLSVASNSNVSHSVSGNTINFNVINLPDGTTETINYEVQLSPGTTQTSITNCAKVEYAGCYQEDCVVLNIGACACPGWPQSIPNGISMSTAAEIQVSTNGDVYVTGALDAPSIIVNCGNTFNVAGPGGFVAKYNSCGKLIWIEAIPIPGVDLALFESGGSTSIFLIGHHEGPPYGSFVSRLDDMGTSVSTSWVHNIPGGNTINGIDIDYSGNIYITGSYYQNVTIPGGSTYFAPNDFAVYIAKFNTSGVFLWSENIINSNVVVPVCGFNPRSLESKGIAVNGSGTIIYLIGNAFNSTVTLGGGCAPLMVTPSSMFCTGHDIFIAAYEGGGSIYSCQWAEQISGEDANVPTSIACDKNNNDFYISGWATNASTSASGFILPPLSGPPSDTRGHFIARYNYTSGIGGSFQSVYRDDFTSQSQATDHFEDVFWDRNNDIIYVTATQPNEPSPYLHKHNPSTIASPVWVVPQPTIDNTRGHSSVATNGLVNSNGFWDVYITGTHDDGVTFSVNTSGGIIPVTFSHSGIFILKIEDQGASGVIKE